jgi:hypothetical protein
MWILDIFLLVSAGMILMDRGSKNHGDDNTEQNSEENDKIPLYEKLSNVVTTILFILIQIFVLIRLDGYTDWNWFTVFIPWFLFEGISIIVSIPVAFLTTYTPPNHENAPFNVETGEHNSEDEVFMAKMQAETEYFEKILEQDREKRYILVHLLRIWQAVFLALQVNGDVDWNWGLVFLPIWVYLFLHYLYAVAYRIWGDSKLKDLDIAAIEGGLVSDPMILVKYQQGNTLKSSSFVFCCGQFVPLFMAIMLVCRLQISDYSTFFIILPIFLIIGCCCCGVFCALCGLSMVDMDTFEQDMNNPQHTQGQYQSPPTNNEAAPVSNPTVVMGEGDYGTFEIHDVGIAQSPLQEMEEGKHVDKDSLTANNNLTSVIPEKKTDKTETRIDVDID